MSSKSNHDPLTGLVLTGGGARAAYQVGVLRAISDITGFQENPFKIITGFSAGAINGTWLASRHEDFATCTKGMWEAWANIEMDQVFKTSSASLAHIAFRWMKDLMSGGVLQDQQISHLLDTSPLNDFLNQKIDFDALKKHIDARTIRGISMISANYHTGQSTAFFAGDQSIEKWEGMNKISVRTDIRAHHVMASSAIPIFFPPIRIGDSFYGDGMVRLTSPLSPAIHMGSDRMLVIGIRGPSGQSQPPPSGEPTISVGEIAGTVLNGLFFDALDADITRMKKLNQAVSFLNEEQFERQIDKIRYIPLLTLNPSEEVVASEECELKHLPVTFNYLLRGLGVTNNKGRDLLSYLAFEPQYMQSLLELGFEDTVKKKHEVLEFFKV